MPLRRWPSDRDSATLVRMDGLRVGVTGARKAGELAEAFRRRGAEPILGSLVTTDLPVDDSELLPAIDDLVIRPPTWFAASTGVGMRLLAEVARRHDRYDALREVLGTRPSIARGAKAVGGLAAFGASPEHVTDEETDGAVVDWLVARLGTDDDVVAQVHGTDHGVYDRLASDGIGLRTVQPYVAGRRPEDEEQARALVRAVAEAEVDVVTFTSPGAARNLFDLAEELGIADAVAASLGDGVAVAVIGPVTAEVFEERTIPIAVHPDRHRQGELVRAVERWAATR